MIQIRLMGEHPNAFPSAHHGAKVAAFALPRIGETFVVQGLAYVVSDVIHMLDDVPAVVLAERT